MNIQSMWLSFSKSASAWASQMRSGGEQAVFESIESLFDNHGVPFFFDITSDGSSCYLIFSPEGDYAVAESIDTVVESVPPLSDWKVLGRRTKKVLADVRAIVKHLYLFDISEAHFRVVCAGLNQRVEMYVPESTDITDEEGQGLVNTFLWHAIGEGTVMDQRITGACFLTDESSNELLSAQELVAKLTR